MTSTIELQRTENWRPILEGAELERAKEAILAVADRLRLPPQSPDRSSVAGGASGLALLYAYLGEGADALGLQRDAKEEAYALSDEALGRAIDAVAEVPMSPTLYGGFPGVAWAAQHLAGRFRPGPADEDPEDDPNQEIDEALLQLLEQTPWRLDYDLISGLAGLGVYARERLPRPTAQLCVSRLLDRLGELAQAQPGGLTFWTSPELLIPETRQTYPDGYYNVGLAHGVPGVVAVLGELVPLLSGEQAAKARALLEGSVGWVLAQRLPPSTSSSFPAFVGPDIQPGPSRFAWCYGDPGVAAALLWAARRAGEPRWEEAALEIARRAAQVPAARTGVVDAALCHGAAGLGHIYNRFYQATGEAVFLEAARGWFGWALDFRAPALGVAGFRSWGPRADQSLGWIDDEGVLTGAAGIALALLGATTPIEPLWDRLLLTSVPPRGGEG